MNARPTDWQEAGSQTLPRPARNHGLTGPEQVRAWRRDRIGHCIAALLRDPAVARAVAEGLASHPRPDTDEARPADAQATRVPRSRWLLAATDRP
jgi:hypothetical protein